MKLLKKPVKPTEADFTRDERKGIEIDLNGELNDVIERLKVLKEKYDDGYISLGVTEKYIYYESDRATVEVTLFTKKLAENEYAKALRAYEVKLAKYERWYSNNEKYILKELARRDNLKKEMLEVKKKYGN